MPSSSLLSDGFRLCREALGVDINPSYVARAQSAVSERGHADRAEIRAGDFFLIDWRAVLDTLPEPLLVIGNPPWVTNAELGALGGRNLPAKSNFQSRSGLDAMTGKSNFDISEWMLIKLLESLSGRRATLAIYRKRPRFAIFGVGDYSFAPWKVAISGLHKRLQFSVIGGFRQKPIVLDDTCYFLACRHEEEARLIHTLLDSDQAREFFGALIFWDAKRPITVDILQQLDLQKLAAELGMDSAFSRFEVPHSASTKQAVNQLGLFESR